MPDLIPFMPRKIGTETIPTVDARDLYECLELTSDYSLWIKRAIKRAHLLENMDYVVSSQVLENPKGGRPATHHHLTFDAAKHVAMMSSVIKGREVRTYFIEKEKELTRLTGTSDGASALPKVKNPAHQMLIDAIVRLDAVEQQAQEAQTQAFEANANALRALEAQPFKTVAEYVFINKLERQLPETAYKACSDHLRLYCQDRNIPFRKIEVGGKRWNHEYGFHDSVYAEVLPSWLRRRFAQSTLRIIAHGPDATS
jgi:phage anti-repressor protein